MHQTRHHAALVGAGIFALLPLALLVARAPEQAKPEDITGKVVRLSDLAAAAGVKLDADAAPFSLVFQADDGKVWSLFKDGGADVLQGPGPPQSTDALDRSSAEGEPDLACARCAQPDQGAASRRLLLVRHLLDQAPRKDDLRVLRRPHETVRGTAAEVISQDQAARGADMAALRGLNALTTRNLPIQRSSKGNGSQRYMWDKSERRKWRLENWCSTKRVKSRRNWVAL